MRRVVHGRDDQASHHIPLLHQRREIFLPTRFSFLGPPSALLSFPSHGDRPYTTRTVLYPIPPLSHVRAKYALRNNVDIAWTVLLPLVSLGCQHGSLAQVLSPSTSIDCFGFGEGSADHAAFAMRTSLMIIILHERPILAALPPKAL